MPISTLKRAASIAILTVLVCSPAWLGNQHARAQQKGLGAVLESEPDVRGLVRSSSRIDYRTELLAPVKQAPLLAGQAFEKGDLLVLLDCSKFDAEKNAAEAVAYAADIESRTKRRLYYWQAAGQDEFELAKAHAARARAELEVHLVRGKFCRFEAPFDGRVVELNSRRHEYPPTDRPLITIIDDSNLELEMVMPSKWLVWVKIGTSFEFTIDETGVTIPAHIVRMGAEVDPVSQTIKVIAEFDGASSGVLAGMSGTARFPAHSG